MKLISFKILYQKKQNEETGEEELIFKNKQYVCTEQVFDLYYSFAQKESYDGDIIVEDIEDDFEEHTITPYPIKSSS